MLDSTAAAAPADAPCHPAAADGSVRVGIGIRVVPAGVEKHGEVSFLRAALLLSPVAAKSDGTGRTVDLKHFPRDVEAILTAACGAETADTPDPADGPASGITLRISPLALAGTARAAPCGASATRVPAYRALHHDLRKHAPDEAGDFAQWRTKRAQDVAEIDRRWGALLVPETREPGKIWDALKAVVEGEAGAMSAALTRRHGPAAPAPGASPSGPPPPAGAEAAPTIEVPNVVSTGRAEAALLLTVERARSLLLRLRADAQGKPEADKPINLAYQPFDPLDWGAGWPSWAGSPPPIVRYASAGAAGPGETESIQDKVLKDAQGEANDLARQESRRRDAPADKLGTALDDRSKAVAARLAERSALVAAASDASPGTPDGLSKRVNELVERHNLATHEEDAAKKAPDKRDCEAVAAEEKARARLFGIQSQPSLARLFGLVVDVLIPWTSVEAAFRAAGASDREGAPVRYAYLSAVLGDGDGGRSIWTTCKLRLHGQRPDVWACDLEEFDYASTRPGDPEDFDRFRMSGVLDHVDGYVPLGARALNGSREDYRFDIASIDVTQATENRITALHNQDKKGVQVLTLRTAGLCLIDHVRADSAVSALARSRERLRAADGCAVIDASDLTVGYRMDVGVGARNGTTAWRSLCNRTVTFDDEKLEGILARIVPDIRRRVAYDSANLVLPARIADDSPSEGATKTAYVENVLGQWLGQPMGGDLESAPIPLLPDCAPLRLGQSYDLDPPKDWTGPWRIPGLVFGAGYRLRLRATLAGGIVRPDGDEAPFWDPGFALPRAEGAARPRRFLRHERLEAPIVATPLPFLEALFDDVRDGFRETGATLVVRSRVEGDARKAGAYKAVADVAHARSVRVFVPPSVPASFADRHDATFTASPELVRYGGGDGWTGPMDGLREVDYDHRAAGGFPVWTLEEGSSGSLDDGDPSKPGEAKGSKAAGGKPGAAAKAAGKGGGKASAAKSAASGKDDIAKAALGGLLGSGAAKPNGDAVFRPRPPALKGVPRREPYYPDPLADHMVFGLRDARGVRIGGRPLVVPVRPDGLAWPQIRPIAVEVVAVPTMSALQPSNERILSLAADRGGAFVGDDVLREDPSKPKRKPAVVRIDADGAILAGGAASGRSVAASHVRIALAPGAHYSLDVWCLPSLGNLNTHFDIVETAALIVGYEPASGRSCKDTDLDCRLVAWTGRNERFLAALLGSMSDEAKTSVSSHGQRSLDARTIRLVGAGIHATARRLHTPEIAARLTIGLTHALDKPLAAPVARLALRRLSPQTREQVIAGTERIPDADEPDSSDVLISGQVEVDPATTGFIEIFASGACLKSGSFDDDIDRSRGKDQVARGLWPEERVTGKPKAPIDVYGFDVADDGLVRLPSEKVLLERIDEPGEEDCAGDLLRLVRKAAQALDFERPGPRATFPFQIRDTRARLVELTVRAGPRAGTLFRDGGTGRVLSADRSTIETPAPQRVVLPSTKAPSKVSALTVLPSFRFETALASEGGGTALVRSTWLRVRMRRPWFSSGEGERLGIVLWPPDIRLGRIDGKGGEVARDYDVRPFIERASIAMQGFSDADLGPGGTFVSRWGRDPVRGGGEGPSWLMPVEAFPDLTSARCHGPTGPDARDCWDPLADGLDREVVYVPRAMMPLAAGADDGASGAGTTGRETMVVSLLTYRPRFDVDQETWYVDVPIDAFTAPEPFVRLGLVRYQPMAPDGLRVSEPVAVWAQVPSARRVEVRYEASERAMLKVSVLGPGSTHSADEAGGYSAASLGWWRRGPLMKMSVLRRRGNVEEPAELQKHPEDAGHEDIDANPGWSERSGQWAARSFVPRTQAEWTGFRDAKLSLAEPSCATASIRPGEALPRLAVPGRKRGTQLVWESRFLLAEDPRKAPPDISYCVFVEEVYAMRPATYPHEPVDENAEAFACDDRLEVSGARFAARLELPGP